MNTEAPSGESPEPTIEDYLRNIMERLESVETQLATVTTQLDSIDALLVERSAG